MSLTCGHQARHGLAACTGSCPARHGGEVFDFVRVQHDADLPAATARTVDIALLDMNHGWPNMGHDSLVRIVRESVCDLAAPLARAGLRVRLLSLDVRRGGTWPSLHGRFPLYVGTGGPGHLDPRRNDGVYEGSQGIVEDPVWERSLFALFDAVRGDEQTALLAVCHTFGVICRWAGIAEPVLRGAEKGGKSSGVLENVLTVEGQEHPWFGRLARHLPERKRLRILDSRLYDLVPSQPLPSGVIGIGYEAQGIGGPAGDALTMLELARDNGGVMPRIFAVNHHPEIFDRTRQIAILAEKHARHEVPEDWYEERMKILTTSYPEEDSDRMIELTSLYTLVAPLRFHLRRALCHRARTLGLNLALDERDVLAETEAQAESGRAVPAPLPQAG